MKIVMNLLIYAFAVFVSAYVLTGVHVADFFTAIIVAIVLGVANTFLKPILILLTLPINIVTLGLFTFVINAILILLVTWLVPGFTVLNFWWALIFSLVLSLINSFLHSLNR